jgi:hypothetical protein
MEVRKDQFPVVIQAYEITGARETFIAEQVVHNQSELNVFSTRYAGKLIKARQLTATESGQLKNTKPKSQRSSAGTIILVIIIILAILVAIGFYTGWIQQTFNMG